MCKNYVNSSLHEKRSAHKDGLLSKNQHFGCIATFDYGSAMIVSGRIIHLLSHKPPGSQTVLDLVAIDAFSK